MASTLLQTLFPCQFNEPRCQHNRFGCRCGKGGSRKAEQRADDLARQQAAQAATTQQAVQAGTAPTPAEQQRMGETFGLEQRQLPRLEGRATAIPEDLVRQLGPEAATYVTQVAQRLGMAPEQLFGGISPAAAALQQQVTGRIGEEPTDLLKPLLALAQEQIANNFARRGMAAGSGLEVEAGTRAANELAVQQAQYRQAIRQQNLENASQLIAAQQGLQEQARGEGASLAEYGGGLSQQARAELANYLANQQQLSEAARNRQTTGLAQSYQLAQPFYGNAAAFNQQGLGALQQRVQQSQQGLQSIGKLATSLGAVVASPFTGGLSLAMLPAIANYGSSSGGGSPASLLSGMRQANASYGSMPVFGNAGGLYQTGGAFGGLFGRPRSPIGVDEAEALRRLGYGSRIA